MFLILFWIMQPTTYLDALYKRYAIILAFIYRPYGWIAPKEWKWHYPPVEPVNWEQYMTSSGNKK